MWSPRQSQCHPLSPETAGGTHTQTPKGWDHNSACNIHYPVHAPMLRDLRLKITLKMKSLWRKLIRARASSQWCEAAHGRICAARHWLFEAVGSGWATSLIREPRVTFCNMKCPFCTCSTFARGTPTLYCKFLTPGMCLSTGIWGRHVCIPTGTLFLMMLFQKAQGYG